MNRTLALLTAAVIGLGSAQAFAEHGGPHDGPHGGPHGGPGQFFDQTDSNKDGFLTKEEMQAAQNARLDEMFTHVDTDKDGKLSKEELEQGRKDMRAKMKERWKQHKDQKPEQK